MADIREAPKELALAVLTELIISKKIKLPLPYMLPLFKKLNTDKVKDEKYESPIT